MDEGGSVTLLRTKGGNDVETNMMDGEEKALVVTPWHNEKQRDAFLAAWFIDYHDERIVMQHDADKEGCAVTKNKGIAEALRRGADIVVVLDDDCYPEHGTVEGVDLGWFDDLIEGHVAALQPQPVQRFQVVTDPASRGTPFHTLDMTMPVAASIGFWTEIGDYCAVRQLAHEARPMACFPQTVFADYFPLCGMNLAFRPKHWEPWCTFIDVPRFDDIWMGWLWQRHAYARGYCFNLCGPVVKHSRQSNVWKNLEHEARYLKQNDTLWREIAQHPPADYEDLCKLLPCSNGHEPETKDDD